MSLPKTPKTADIDRLLASMVDEEVHNSISSFGITAIPQMAETGTKVIFRTEDDERVCDLCESYDGEEYEVDDPDRPTVPLHLNCRCYYEHSDLPIIYEGP